MFLENGRFRPRSVSLVFWCHFESRFPTVIFEKLKMPIMLLGAETDLICASSQFTTPNNIIGSSEVARDVVYAGWSRLPLVGGRFFLMPESWPE
jgi:hypothetical protein